MIEKSIFIDTTILIEVLGQNNNNINLLINNFPKLKIVIRDNEIKLFGSAIEIGLFETKFELLLLHFEKFNSLTEFDIKKILTNSDNEIQIEKIKNDLKDLSVLLHGNNGRVIKAKTRNQQRLVESSMLNDMIFAIGPAGTGKTYTAVALAVKALKNKEIKRIILTRPAVEAGENLGFLPGDLRDKLDPYLQPLYDALRDMIPPQKLISYIEDKTIEIAPLAFMRGRTLDNAYVILDEAQNATQGQLKMFLTRMGMNAKFFITGDITQIDLPRNQQSGLVMSQNLLKNIKGIDFIILDKSDVVRHHLVSQIIEAYSNFEENINNKK